MKPDDLGAVVDIERRGGGRWICDHFVAEINNPNADALVLYGNDDKTPQAFIVFWTVADEVELVNIAVAPDRRRQGLGRVLISHLLTVASTRGAATVYLEVRRGNLAAITLYESLGFSRCGERRGYYQPQRPGASVEDALLFVHPLSR